MVTTRGHPDANHHHHFYHQYLKVDTFTIPQRIDLESVSSCYKNVLRRNFTLLGELYDAPPDLVNYREESPLLRPQRIFGTQRG